MNICAGSGNYNSAFVVVVNNLRLIFKKNFIKKGFQYIYCHLPKEYKYEVRVLDKKNFVILVDNKIVYQEHTKNDIKVEK